MKYILQFEIIIAISLIGELLNRIIPLPIPASIYGMVILFTALCTGVIKLSAVRETGKFLIYIMPMMFIPATVGLLDSWSVMQEFLTAIIVISLVSTVLVMVFTGHITQFIIKLKNRLYVHSYVRLHGFLRKWYSHSANRLHKHTNRFRYR